MHTTLPFVFAAGFVASVVAAPAAHKPTHTHISQISYGQHEAPAYGYSTPSTTATAVSEIGDGQVQASASADTNASPFGYYSYPQEPTLDTSALEAAATYAGVATSDIPGASLSADPRVSSQVTGITSHGPYSGPAPTTTGAVTTEALMHSIPTLPPNPTALKYNPNGLLNDKEPIPYQPAGGLGTNGSEPVYRVQSDFDYESLLLGLYQEWIELDLFHNILATFSKEDFEAEGLTESDRFLIEFMADQESGHATLISNLLGGPGGATPQCTYNYPFTTLREAFDFTQKLTRFGESGVWGFQSHLDSREVAQLLDQSIATEARQQMIFRQFAGLFPMPVWFEAGIPQSWQWTVLAPYISECPANAKRLAWQNFPALTVLNQPNSARKDARKGNEVTGFGPAAPSSDKIPASESCINTNQTGFDCSASISQNRSIPLSYPGRELFLEWENPGLAVGPNNSYVTSTSTSGEAKFLIWVSQLNVTYSPLYNVSERDGKNYAQTRQPDVMVFEGEGAINGTMFVAVTENDRSYTAFNLSMVNPHVVAGPFLYQSG